MLYTALILKTVPYWICADQAENSFRRKSNAGEFIAGDARDI